MSSQEHGREEDTLRQSTLGFYQIEESLAYGSGYTDLLLQLVCLLAV